jgi:hypothetical protein
LTRASLRFVDLRNSRLGLSGRWDCEINVKVSMKSVAIAFLVCVIAVGCTAWNTVEPLDLVKYQSDSSFHNLWYMGSDDSFHYFRHLDKTKSYYKVRKIDLKWSNEEEYGQLKQYVLVLPGAIESALQP